METKILTTIQKYRMLEAGGSIVAGVSGGADSMCLLHFLYILRKDWNLTVIAAHVNHGLRGEEAKRDEEFVQSWCEAHGVPFEVLHADVNALAKVSGQGTEACGRDVRYRFFSGLAEKYGASIATAHTASDNAETVLFHLIRGTGTRGLSGIKPVRGNIVRPLIEITREEVEAYCRENDVPYLTDSTNLRDDYTRNRLRHHLVPLCKEINPSFEKGVLRLSETLSHDDTYIMEQAEAALDNARLGNGTYSGKMLAALPAPVLARAVMLCAQAFSCRCMEQKHISAVCGFIYEGAGACDLPCGLQAIVSQGMFRIVQKEKPAEKWEIPLTDAVSLTKYNKKLNVCVCSKMEYDKKTKFNKKLLNNSMDYAIISKHPAFRTRREGDTFLPLGKNGTKTVKKLFNEYKIPREQRGKILLLARGSEVLWIDGYGVSPHAAVSDKTQRVLIINVETAEG